MRSECEIAAESPSSTACQTVPRIAMMNAAIIVLEWPGSSPCSAPSKMAVGTKSHACAEPCESAWEKSESASGIAKG